LFFLQIVRLSGFAGLAVHKSVSIVNLVVSNEDRRHRNARDDIFTALL